MQGHEQYAVDYSLEWEADLYTRPTPEDEMLHEWELADREERARRAATAAFGGDDLARFRAAGETVRRLRSEGKGVREIMGAMKLKDPGAVRRLESVLDWLELAGDNPRAAALASLSKRAFLAVVSREIYTVDDLAERADELVGLPAFEEPVLSEINRLLASTAEDAPILQ